MKLVKKCKTKFAERPDNEEFYLHQVIRNIGTIISDLEETEVPFNAVNVNDCPSLTSKIRFKVSTRELES